MFPGELSEITRNFAIGSETRHATRQSGDFYFAERVKSEASISRGKFHPPLESTGDKRVGS